MNIIDFILPRLPVAVAGLAMFMLIFARPALHDWRECRRKREARRRGFDVMK